METPLNEPRPFFWSDALARVALVGAMILPVGCHSTVEPGSVTAPAVADDPASELVRAFNKERAGHLQARAAEAFKPSGLSEALKMRSEAGELRYGAALQAIYEADGYTPRLVRRGELTPTGQIALERLQAASSHGLDPARYGVGPLEASAQALREQASQIARKSGDVPALTDGEMVALATLLRERNVTAPEPAVDAILDALLSGDPASSPAPAVATWYKNHLTNLNQAAALSAEVEVRLADGVLGLAHDLRFRNTRHLDAGQIASMGADKAGEAAAQRWYVELLRVLLNHPTDEQARTDATSRFNALEPGSRQYTLLRGALEKYRKIQASGGWPTDLPRIPRPKPKEEIVRYSGKSKKIPEGFVLKVKQTLAAHGYYSGAIDDTWSEDMDEPLVRYRRAHQLWDRPWIDYELVEVMKIPVEFRVAQLEITLARWRESRIGGEDYYVFVNLPDFFAEIWDKGERAMRFRVVVGKNSRYRDSKTREWVYPNATPTFSARMESVVFAPYWNVPSRIKIQEIDKAVAKNPNYLQENNFEVVVSEHGHEMVRQRPGPGNALGKVKLLFPNDHDVYIHDTPRKDLFANPFRAYSHGCMRAENPLELAQYILSREDGSWTERRVRSAGAGTAESWQRLNQGPMVHIEYYTARVDDNGDVQFLADIYNYDAQRIKDEKGIDIGLVD